MRILALITARAGSKRVPGKNIRVLGDKPLVVWSIDVVRDISDICDTLVSTDDQGIAALCKKAGAYVPWLRPPTLATDTAKSIDVALHALDWYESEKGPVDGVMLLQPTSPFRSRKTVQKGIELFSQSNAPAVLGVSPVTAHPMWTFNIANNRLVPLMKEHKFDTRSQDLTPAYVVDGSLYLITPRALRDNHSFIVPNAVPIVSSSPQEALDIDTEWDFNLAEYMVKNFR